MSTAQFGAQDIQHLFLPIDGPLPSKLTDLNAPLGQRPSAITAVEITERLEDLK